MLKEQIFFNNYHQSIKLVRYGTKIEETVQFNGLFEKLSHVKNLYMFNSKGDNFTDEHFKTSFAKTSCINIRIKLDFLCLNISWAPRAVSKLEPERRGFQYLPRGLAEVNVSEKYV